MHGHFAYALQYVVATFGHRRIAHERTVHHHGTETFAPFLLQNEHHLTDLCLGIGRTEVESLLPSGIGLQHGEYLQNVGVQGMRVGSCTYHCVDEVLKNVVRVSAYRVADGVPHLGGGWAYLGAHRYELVFRLLFLIHCKTGIRSNFSINV